MVKVGYVEWLSVNSLPASRSRARFGVSAASIASGRRPSQTTIKTFLSGGALPRCPEPVAHDRKRKTAAAIAPRKATVRGLVMRLLPPAARPEAATECQARRSGTVPASLECAIGAPPPPGE